MSSTQRLTRGSVRRALALSAAGAMVFALTPVQSAFAQTAPAARDIAEADDPCVRHQDDTEAFDDINDERIDFAAECLNDLNIARGFGDNKYGPTQFVTREQMASFISRKLESAVEYDRPDDAPEANFTDRAEIAQVHVNNVDILASLGIVEGFDDNSYRPGAAVTRGQMASFIVREMEEITGQELTATEDYFEDDDGTTHEDNINVVAEYGIAEGVEGGGFEPHESVTRGQMALFIARNIDALNNEFGITFEPVAEPTATNQTFTVAAAGAEDEIQAEGTTRDFVFDVADAETVDIALVACDNVTVDADGNVVFTDTNNDGLADFGTVDDTTITEVNGVVRPASIYVDNASATADGEVSLTIQHDGAGRECVVVVVFDDADDDDRLDVDASGLPTEDFGISGDTEFVTVAALDAEPETAVNRFASEHTVTAQLEDGAGASVALAGETVRFQVFRGGTEGVDANANAVCTGGTVVGTGTGTTDATGEAQFTYTGPADPDANTTGQSVDDCIVVFHDADGDGVLDANENSDVVTKTWQDVSGVTTLDAAPESDTNPVGTAHTVTATITNEFGEPVSGATVRFEVYRDGATQNDTADSNPHNANRSTGTDGTVTFSYTGPAASDDDVIVVCLLEGAETTCDAAAAGSIAVGDTFAVIAASADAEDDVDSVRKYWVEAAATDGSEEAAGDEVVGFDTTSDIIDTDDNLRYQYTTSDQFFVACSATPGTFAPVSYAQFEAALSTGDLLTTTNYDPTEVSQFSLVDSDDSGTTC